MKKLSIVFVLLCMFLATGCGQKEILSEEKNQEGLTYQETNKKTDNVMIELEDERKIFLELYPKVAPISVKNFQKLVESDFYNDIIFHRVVRDFVIQAGDGTSLGRNASTIKGEFAENGVENNLHHERGILSMARAMTNDSASSQFFIVLETNEKSDYLDGKYAAFGRVIAGMDVVDEIGSVVTDSNDKPIKDIKIKRAEFIKIVGENK